MGGDDYRVREERGAYHSMVREGSLRETAFEHCPEWNGKENYKV